jgi:hypothetical protein
MKSPTKSVSIINRDITILVLVFDMKTVVSSPGVKRGRGVILTLLVPRLRKRRAIPLLPSTAFHGV